MRLMSWLTGGHRWFRIRRGLARWGGFPHLYGRVQGIVPEFQQWTGVGAARLRDVLDRVAPGKQLSVDVTLERRLAVVGPAFQPGEAQPRRLFDPPQFGRQLPSGRGSQGKSAVMR
ncbi:hypothetical protein L4B83_16495 [Streptomyces sp. PSAA01]|nr:hypothetical protein [Streptomyces sp. PSAA01]MCG0286534.1 hypothetical protein [Streptomyces sp. PSAA01]